MHDETTAVDAIAETAVADGANVGERISKRNLIMFPLGTLGRDFLYAFFNSYLITFILLTKTLTPAQFASITIIIICARIFDALNDPIMGGIVENTRTKWGKYKPWQVIGAVLTGGVIIALFNVKLDGWAFIGFLAFAYFMFSITFTMNDISYWGMMPTLTTNGHDRDKLASFTQIVGSAGAGIAGVLVPVLTTGFIGTAVFGNAVTGYRVLSIAVVVLMLGFQLFTILGVQEKPLPKNFVRTERTKLKDLFRIIFKNDQLLWCSLIMLIFNVGTNVVSGGLSTFYIYFEFAYDGMLLTVFGIGFAILSAVFMLAYPWISKKFGRDKILYSTGIAIIASYILMMIVGLAIPSASSFKSALGITKFVLMSLAYTIAGWGGGFYMIMVINMANTVEYNEFRTGKREEGLIFSMRPLTCKLGSALMQGVVSLVLLVAGVLTVTNNISNLENQQASNLISPEAKLEGINNIIAGVSQESKMILLVCMCLIPAVFLSVALILYKKKCVLNEQKMAEMVSVIEERKLQQKNGEAQTDEAVDVEDGAQNDVENKESEDDRNALQAEADSDGDEDIKDDEVANECENGKDAPDVSENVGDCPEEDTDTCEDNLSQSDENLSDSAPQEQSDSDGMVATDVQE